MKLMMKRTHIEKGIEEKDRMSRRPHLRLGL
jgi:hypothetical protein